MIRLQDLSIVKLPKEYNADGSVKDYEYAVVTGDSRISYCDTETEAEEFIGFVRLQTAVHNNFRAKRIGR